MVPPPVGPGESKLQYPYAIWFTQRQRGSVSATPSSYEDNIKLVGTFNSVRHTFFIVCIYLLLFTFEQLDKLVSKQPMLEDTAYLCTSTLVSFLPK